jgi:hypothetical protein
MSDDLDELARAAQVARVRVHPSRMQTHTVHYVPGQRKQYSPFMWGLGITIGIFAGLFGLAFMGGVFNGCNAAIEQRLQQQQQQQAQPPPIVLPSPQKAPVFVPTYTREDGTIVPAHYIRDDR